MGLKALFSKTKKSAAVFVDFEHWCYSLNSRFNLKPQIVEWYDNLSERFDIKRIFFFGDFTEPRLKSFIDEIRRVTNNVIDTQNPSTYLKKDYTDFIMLDYIYQDVDEYSKTDVYVIFSGDGHFSSVATYLKTKKKKIVLVYGVKESMSQKLRKIADECFIVPTDDQQMFEYKKMIIDNLDYLGRQPKITFPTYMNTIKIVAEKNRVHEDKITEAMKNLMDSGIITQEFVRGQIKNLIKILKVNWDLAVRNGLATPETDQ